MDWSGDVVPFRFDLSALVRRSVTTLYSHLVTRPTGQALRLGIESQIGDLGAPCLSILDFAQVVVLDYSCADEVVAKLLRRYAAEDRPGEAFFVALGLGAHHMGTLDTVLRRQDLAMIAQIEGRSFTLVGSVSEEERRIWHELERAGSIRAEELAAALEMEPRPVESGLDRLVERRTAFREARPPHYRAVSSLIASPL